MDIGIESLKMINNFNKEIEKIYEYQFNDARKNVYDLIEKLVDKQIIIIIDNLEKTRPEFIISFLHKMREFFETLDKWLFILSYDKNEIENSLKAFYGENFNTQGFFRKFIHTEFKLGRFYNYINNSKEEHNYEIFKLLISIIYKEVNQKVLENKLNLEKENINEKSFLLRDNFLSLRLLRLIEMKIDIIRNNNNNKFFETYKAFILLLIFLKIINEKEYDLLFETLELNLEIEKNNFKDLFKIKNIIKDKISNIRNIDDTEFLEKLKETIEFLELTMYRS
jgi:hypothetical protein